MSLKFTTLDVFTDTRFQGNPLALVHVPKDLPVTQAQKQAIAFEFNLSETVFLHEDVESPSGRRLDIFMPTAEIPFAGHPTIGTLCYIGIVENKSTSTKIKLSVKAGPIEALFHGETLSAEAAIPHNVHVHASLIDLEPIVATQPGLRGASTSSDVSAHADAFPMVSIVKGMTFIMVDLPSVEQHLSAVKVSSRAIPNAEEKIDEGWGTTVLGSMFYVKMPPSEARAIRLRTRMIENGGGEDPATGSASCGLAAYLALQHGQAGETYRFEMTQGVEMGRDSHIGVRVKLDEKGQGVKGIWLSGRSIMVSEGIIRL